MNGRWKRASSGHCEECDGAFEAHGYDGECPTGTPQRTRLGRALVEMRALWHEARQRDTSLRGSALVALRAFAWGWHAHGCICMGAVRGLEVVHDASRCWDPADDKRRLAEDGALA